MLTLPKLKMQGRSGCKLQVFMGGDEGAFVRKYSSSLSYNARLIKQAKKQRYFAQMEAAMAFKTPKIYDIWDTALSETDLNWFDMEFISGEKYSDLFERITIPEIERMLKSFEAYFEHSIKQCTYQVPESNVISEKVSSLQQALHNQYHLDNVLVEETLHFLATAIPTEPLPLGVCHGDFTLSNVLFMSPDSMYLLDFLDSFIESPLIDMVKLRQDSKFNWSLMLEGTELEQYKINKITQLLRYFDQQMNQYFLKYPFYESWYKYMEKFNLMRILPYVSETHEIAFVQDCLRNQTF